MEKNLVGIAAIASPKMHGFSRHVIACNAHEPSLYSRFYIEERPVGFIRNDRRALLQPHGDVFTLAEGRIEFKGDSEALAKVVTALSAAGHFKLRHELYAVKEFWGGEDLATIDRGAVWFFGIHAYGVHVNGMVRKPDSLYLWIGKRALDRPVDPGKLDCMIGGGMTAGLTPMQVVIKEAAEEAGLSEEIAQAAAPVGSVSYRFDAAQGLKDDTLFIYDLLLDDSVVPHNTDGEMTGFELLPVAEVARLVRDTDEFKFNCNLVLIDFLIRHGYLDAG
jgi:8-oxo-dGTP pyrophosphatase MutT (NUDIX family)